MDNYGLISLLPPIVAIGLALWTREIFLSLLFGIWIGFLILAEGNLFTASLETIDGLVKVFEDPGNTRIIIFTLIVGALIALIQRSGGVSGFINILLSALKIQILKAKG